MKHFILATLSLVSLTSPLFVFAEILNVKNGSMQFEAVGRPSMVKIKGRGEGAEGILKLEGVKISGEIKMKLSVLDTGIELRNDHMKEKYLEIQKFPEAVLTIHEMPMPQTWSLANAELSDSPFSGTLELHGEKNEVKGSYTISRKKAIEAKFETKISDYKIEIPSYLGVTVADTVKVKVTFEDISN